MIREMRFLVAGLALFLASVANAQEKYPECAQSTVHSIDIPVKDGDPARIRLRYEFHPSKSRKPVTTIVFVPSGPGNRNIFAARDHYAEDYFMSEQADLVGLEYRGVGCNADQTTVLKEDDYSLKQAADDFNEVIRQLGLKNYILFGVGNGSAVARIMASRAHRDRIPDPQSIVYTAAVGRAWSRHERFKAGTLEEWGRLRQELSPDILKFIRSETYFNGLSAATWGNFFFDRLWPAWSHGADGMKTHRLIQAIEILRGPDEAAKARLYKAVAGIGTDSKAMAVDNSFSRRVLCRELSQTDDDTIELHQGELVLKEDARFCAGTKLKKPYRAGRWPVQVPQYLIEGARDPLIPAWQVRELLRESTPVDNSVLWGTESGHGVTIFSFADCREAIWSRVFSGRPFLGALQECKAPHEIDFQPRQ